VWKRFTVSVLLVALTLGAFVVLKFLGAKGGDTPAPQTEVPGEELAAVTAAVATPSAEEAELLKQYTPEEIEKLKYSHEAALAANQNVVFYGLCIDQDGNPIEGVTVEAKLSKMRKSMVSAVLNESFKYHENLTTVTNEDGRFEFKDEGSYLHLEKIHRPGYLDARGPKSFGFSFGQILYGKAMAGMHQPDPLHPVVFTLWKQGEGSATLNTKRRLTYHADIGMAKSDLSEPHYFDLSEGIQKSEPSSYTIEVIARNEGDRHRDSASGEIIGSRYKAWDYTLKMPSGGIVKTDDLFLYRPPEEGYEEYYRFSVPEGEKEWIGRIEGQKFYFKTFDGKFGAFVLRVDALANGSMGFRFEKIYFNPEGERNLEYFE
jgi:hypothetical protein